MKPNYLYESSSMIVININNPVWLRSYLKKVLLIASIFCFCGVLQAQVNLNNGLVAYYPFNGNANDESGNENNGYIFGASLTADRFGKIASAYSFDGVDDKIIVHHSKALNLNYDFSVSFWIKSQGLNSNDQSLFLDKADWNNKTGWGFLDDGQYSSQIIFRVLPGAPQYEVAFTRNLINDNTWHHLVGVRKNGTMTFYLDNSLMITYSANYNICTNDLIIGEFKGNKGDGKMDDIRIYNRAISVQEINSLFIGFLDNSESNIPQSDKYKVWDVELNWYDAKAYCESIGGHLATITSAEELTNILKLLESHSSIEFYWLGGTDQVNEGQWKWITGEKWEYTNWDIENGEPNQYNGTEEDYLQLYNYYSRKRGTWNDLLPTSPNNLTPKYGFICELDTGIFSVSPKSAANSEKFSDLSICAYPITSDCRIELVNGEKTIYPDSILERNIYNIKARFSFKNKPLGVYDALFISPDDTMKLEKCFTLIYQSEAIEPTDTDNDDIRNISSFGHLIWISQHSESWLWSYELDNDIDADETKNWYDGKGLNPISEFSGTLDGQGNKIKFLYINRPDQDNVALFGQLSKNGTIRNLGLTSCNIIGKNYTASIVGSNNGGTVSNCYSSGTIKGNENIGGIVGDNNGPVKFCYNSALINGANNIGGIVGNGSVSSSISKSYNIGKVVGKNLNIGGIIGANSGNISNCFNNGVAIGAGEVAGISGRNYGTISNTYNRGYINGTGGYCGAINGYGNGSITNSFWDNENSGLTTSNGGTGKTLAEMKTQSTYSNWDFLSVWEIIPTMNNGYPQLTWATSTILVKSYAPERVANSGTSTITFDGIGFDKNTKVCLYKAGNDTIKADSLNTSDAYCAAHFNFNKAALGIWNILIQYPDTTITIKNGLTIEEKKTGTLDIEILGADQFRKGRTTTVTVRVTNTGNTTIEQPFIHIAIDSEDSTFTIGYNEIGKTAKDLCASVNLNVDNFVFFNVDNMLGHYARKCKFGVFMANTLYPYSSTELVFNLKSSGNISISAWKANYTFEDFKNAAIETATSYKSVSLYQKYFVSEDLEPTYQCVKEYMDCLDLWKQEAAKYMFTPEQLKQSLLFAGLGAINECIGITLGLSDLATSDNKFMPSLSGFIVSTIASKYISLAGKAGIIEVPGAIIAVPYAVVLELLTKNIYNLYTEIKFNNKAYKLCGEILDVCNSSEEKSIKDILAVDSCDPNDKYGYRSPSGSKYFNEDKTNFTYVIEFENKETATAAAQKVFVTDTLDSNVFDVESFKAGSLKIGEKTYDASFNARDAKWSIDMRPDMNYITYVTLKLDTATGVAQWYFKSVDPVTLDWPSDPTAGFLPPNDSTNRGQGSVSFTINLKEGISDDATLNNRASIVFDYNKPIMTPTWSNKKDIIAPTSIMNPAVLASHTTTSISWQGQDNKGGSGVYCYNVFVKKGTGEYTALFTRSPQTSTDFMFEKGVEYSFYVIAVDSAENKEAKIKVPDITFYDNSVAVKHLHLSYKGEMIVYPNPSKFGNDIQVEFTYPEESLRHGSLIITSLNGTVVRTINQLKEKMVIIGLRSGVYTVNLVIGCKDSQCEKIVVE